MKDQNDTQTGDLLQAGEMHFEEYKQQIQKYAVQMDESEQAATLAKLNLGAAISQLREHVKNNIEQHPEFAKKLSTGKLSLAAPKFLTWIEEEYHIKKSSVSNYEKAAVTFLNLDSFHTTPVHLLVQVTTGKADEQKEKLKKSKAYIKKNGRLDEEFIKSLKAPKIEKPTEPKSTSDEEKFSEASGNVRDKVLMLETVIAQYRKRYGKAQFDIAPFEWEWSEETEYRDDAGAAHEEPQPKPQPEPEPTAADVEGALTETLNAVKAINAMPQKAQKNTAAAALFTKLLGENVAVTKLRAKAQRQKIINKVRIALGLVGAKGDKADGEAGELFDELSIYANA